MHYPQSASGLQYIGYPVGPNSRSLQLGADASANTKGAYAQFVASSPFGCNRITIICQNPEVTNAGRQWLYDLATGAGGAETVLVPNMCVSNGGGFNAVQHVQIPLDIPASTRIVARCQCSTGGDDIFVGIQLEKAGDTPGPTSYVNYGSNTGDSGATSVDPGGTVDTKGAYSAITTSTSAVTQILVLMFTTAGNTVPQTAIWSLDLATGAGGAETVLIPDLKIAAVMQTTTGAMSTRGLTFLTYIAASTRVAVRASCNINDATDRLIDVALLAATAPAEAASGGGAFTYGG